MKKLAIITLCTMASLPLLAGCTKNNVLHGMYDGLRIHNDLQSTPAERVGRPDPPSYGDYERMRKERAAQNPGENR